MLSKNLRIIPSRTAISRAICSTTIPCVQRLKTERERKRGRRGRRERLVRKNLLSPPLRETKLYRATFPPLINSNGITFGINYNIETDDRAEEFCGREEKASWGIDAQFEERIESVVYLTTR